MITADFARYYAQLLILQYFGQPNASAFIQALVTPVIMDQLPLAVQNAFTIGSASGVQLDVIGKYVGASRSGYVFAQPVSLSDLDYLQLIRLKIVQNCAGSSLFDILNLILVNFKGQIFITDSADMELNYVLLNNIGTSTLLHFIVQNNYLPAPMGVGVSATIINDHPFPFFDMRDYNDPATGAPFNSYGSYSTSTTWLSYEV